MIMAGDTAQNIELAYQGGGPEFDLKLMKNKINFNICLSGKTT